MTMAHLSPSVDRDRRIDAPDTVYTPCLKNCKLIFCQNFAKFRRIVKIFRNKIAERTSFSEVCSFSTSPNLCQALPYETQMFKIVT